MFNQHLVQSKHTNSFVVVLLEYIQTFPFDGHSYYQLLAITNPLANHVFVIACISVG